MRRMQSIALALFIFFITPPFAYGEDPPTVDGIYSRWRFNPNLVVGYPGEYRATSLTFRIGDATITSYSYPVRSLNLHSYSSEFERGAQLRIQLGSGFSIVTHAWTGPSFPLPRGVSLSKTPNAYLDYHLLGYDIHATQQDGGIRIGPAFTW